MSDTWYPPYGGLPTGYTPAPPECQHVWVEYVGLKEFYFFCSKCDKKVDKKPEKKEGPVYG